MRPLQLPTCFRRLYGAALAGVLGPLIEPHLCADQAAVAGGHCGPNITRAFAHLTRAGRDTTAPTALWHLVMGAAAGPVDALAVAADDAAIRAVPAVLFADQSKAF